MAIAYLKKKSTPKESDTRKIDTPRQESKVFNKLKGMTKKKG